MQELNILLITASIREGRQTPKVAEALRQKLALQKNINLSQIDLWELNLPFFTDTEPTGPALTLLEAYKKADGIIIVTPEYNHSIPAAAKNMIDYAVEKELYGKPLMQVGVSSKNFGGVRAIKELAHIWHAVGGIALPVFLPTPFVTEFDAANPPKDWSERADATLERAIYWFRVMKAGKESLA